MLAKWSLAFKCQKMFSFCNFVHVNFGAAECLQRERVLLYTLTKGMN